MEGAACRPAMLYDPIHKLLCSFPRVIADLLRGYVGGNLVPRLDFKTLDPAPTEQVSDRLERKLSDSVWRVQCDDGQWVWVYVVVEFQSRPDPGMGLRMLAYVALQYLDLQRQRGSHERVPAVLGAVLYSGEEAWVEELDTRSRIALQPGSDVECMLPHLRFPVIHERREGRRKVPRGNAAGLMFRLWGLERQRELLELVAQVRIVAGGRSGPAIAGGIRVADRSGSDPGVFSGGVGDAVINEWRGGARKGPRGNVAGLMFRTVGAGAAACGRCADWLT